MKTFFRFIFAVIVAFIPGIIGMFFTPNGVPNLWYNALDKSALTPAGGVFAVAWIILYFLMGVALFLVMNNERTRIDKGRAYWLFVIQMVLNTLWSYFFFGAHWPVLALVTLVVLILVSVWMMRAFFAISRGAGWLILPYILWMFFAVYLNSVIVFLN